MQDSQKAAIEEAAKLPTAEETLQIAYDAIKANQSPDHKDVDPVLLHAIESHTQAHTKELRAALSGIVEAWETLPEGHHTRETIQKWLIKDMHPSIVKAREVLTS